MNKKGWVAALWVFLFFDVILLGVFYTENARRVALIFIIGYAFYRMVLAIWEWLQEKI